MDLITETKNDTSPDKAVQAEDKRRIAWLIDTFKQRQKQNMSIVRYCILLHLPNTYTQKMGLILCLDHLLTLLLV